jgi:hypothetical protein
LGKGQGRGGDEDDQAGLPGRGTAGRVQNPGGAREQRKVAKWGTIKFEGNQYHSEAAAGSTIEVRYNPFDLRKVWRFEEGKKVETLGLKKLVNPAVEKLPEERKKAEPQASAAAADYFASLREKQQELDRQGKVVNYHKLGGEKAQ